MLLQPPRSTRTVPLFPYPSLFRSLPGRGVVRRERGGGAEAVYQIRVGDERAAEAHCVGRAGGDRRLRRFQAIILVQHERAAEHGPDLRRYLGLIASAERAVRALLSELEEGDPDTVECRRGRHENGSGVRIGDGLDRRRAVQGKSVSVSVELGGG